MIDALTRTVVPPKPALWLRWASLPMFSYYHRLASGVLIGNAVFVLLALDLQAIAVQTM